MEICLGMQASGKLFCTKLKQARHFVICGYSGCGKTELAYRLIEQLDDVQVYILNPLKIYYQDFIDKPNISIAKTPDEIKNCLKKVSNEIDNRARIFNPTARTIVVIADGYQSYGWTFDFNALPYLEKIANSEKANIHLILTTQYTKKPQLFKNILLNSSTICMSIDYRKLFLNYYNKNLPNNCNILAQIIGENEFIELLPHYFPLLTKIN